MHFLALPMAAVFCFRDRLVKQSRKIIRVRISAKNNVAAASAITAIWSTFWHKFLAPKAHATTSPIAGLRDNFYAVNKHQSPNVIATR